MKYRVDSSQDIQHYGVKGMHWGVHKKSHDDSPNADYTSRQRAIDRGQHGKRAEVRINRKLNAGKTRQQALRSEGLRDYHQALAVAGGVAAVRLLQVYGPVAMQGIAIKAESNRGKAAAAQALKNASTIKAKRNRKGVYNISSL